MMKEKVEAEFNPFAAMLQEFYYTFEEAPFKLFRNHCDELLQQIPITEQPKFFESLLCVLSPKDSVKKMALYLIKTTRPIYQIIGLELIQILEEPYFIPFIEPFIYSPHKPLQQCAIRTVLQIKGNAEAILEQNLADRSEWKKEITVKVLREINPYNPKLLLLQLNSEDHVEVITAIERLEESKNKKMVPKLSPLLANSDISIRAAAIEAIGSLGGKKARRILEHHMDFESFARLKDKIMQYI